MTLTTQIDTVKLQKIAKESPLAEAVFLAMAGMGRTRGTTDLRRLRGRVMDAGMLVEWNDFMSIFKKLEQAGFGKIILARRPTDPHRFSWNHFNVIEVGRSALGRNEPKKEPAERIRPGWISTAYPLRNAVLKLELPADLTKKEAKELAEFIQRFGR